MKAKIYFISFLFSTMIAFQSVAVNNLQPGNSIFNKPYFIENKGQWDSDVLYQVQINGESSWITKNGVAISSHALEMQLVGVGNDLNTVNTINSTAYVNYLIGNDPSKYRRNIPLSDEVVVKNIYQGIDIRYYFQEDKLRFDFLVAPKADISRIAISFNGAKSQTITSQGEISLSTDNGDVVIGDLKTFQH